METVTLLGISGCNAKGKAHPGGDLLALWLKKIKCCKQVEKAIKDGNEISGEDVATIRAFLGFPLSEAEKIIFRDLLEMDNGFDTKRAGTFDRLVKLKLARIQKRNKRIKATRYAFDKRIQFILGIDN